MSRLLIKEIIIAWISIFICLISAATILAFLVRFTSISYTMTSILSITIVFIILFITSLITGYKIGQTGLLIGLILVSGFSFLTFSIQYLGHDQAFTMKQFLFHALYMLTAIIASIIGVNISSVKDK